MPFRPNVAGQRGPSPTIWNQSRFQEMRGDPSVGFFFHDDFADLPTGRYGTTTIDDGEFVLTDGGGSPNDSYHSREGGLALATNISSIEGGGITIRLGSTVGAGCVLPETDSRICFECRVKPANVDAGAMQFCIGLCDATSAPITGAGTPAISTTNVTDAILFTTIKSGAAGNDLYTYNRKPGSSNIVVSDSAIASWTDDGSNQNSNGNYLKLGFVCESNERIRYFVNGVEQLAFEQTTGIPTTNKMTFALVNQTGANQNTTNVYLDWWRFSKCYRK